MGKFRNFILNETKAKMDTDVDTFTRQYIITALWCSTDDDQEPLDDNYNINDFDEESLEIIKKDCQKFQDENSELFIKGGWDLEQAAHDFLLTRNRHGAGFWDRSENEGYDTKIGKQLTDVARKFGEQDIIVGDDEKLSVYPSK